MQYTCTDCNQKKKTKKKKKKKTYKNKNMYFCKYYQDKFNIIFFILVESIKGCSF